MEALLRGVIHMQRWKAKHAKKVIAGGALRGLKYEDLDSEQLSRAAKRYPADPMLQKYAKVVVSPRELDGDEAEPEPCLPLALKGGSQQITASSKHSRCFSLAAWLYRLNLRRAFVFAIMAVLLVCVLKPSLATACTRVFVRMLRLMLRRITGFIALLLEGLLDELVYQIELTIRSALPANVDLEQMAQAPLNLISRLFSALTGAGISLLTHYMHARRQHVPAID